MRKITKGYVDIPQAQSHYHMVSGSEPAIVFLHQTTLSARWPPRHRRQRQPLDVSVLLLTTPGDFLHMSFDRAEAIFPQARTAVTGGDNFPTAIYPVGVASAVARFVGSLPG